MAKCIHCLFNFPEEEITKDHVLPASWYPSTTPSELEKWSAPSCRKCNNRLGRIEDDLMTLFALCLDRDDPASQGVHERALRSINPELARNKKDRGHRESKRKRILSRVIKHDQLPTYGYLPNFGLDSPWAGQSKTSVQFPTEWLDEFGKKHLRGAIYAIDKAFVPHEYAIDIIFPKNNAEVLSIKAMLLQLGEQFYRGPGWKITRGISKEDPLIGIYHFEIWDRFEFYAGVDTKLNNEVLLEKGSSGVRHSEKE